MATRIQVRRGTSTQWNDTDPTLAEGEIGYNTSLGQFKIGDGSSLWSELYYVVDSSSLNTSLGAYLLDTDKSAANGIAELDSGKNILAPSGIVFEGATVDAYQTSLVVTDPTADRTITFPNATGTIALTSDIAELSQDAIDAALIAGDGITKTYVDGSNTLTLDIDITTSGGLKIDTGKLTVDPLITQLRVSGVTDTEIGYLDGVTSSIQTQIGTKAPTESPTFTGTVSGVTATHVGLGNVTNTSDANKPVSTAQQTALDLKANLASPTFTGTVSAAALTLSGNLIVNGTTTTINSTTLSVDDKNIILGDIASPTDVTADGGGITLLGTTDKTFNWVDATDAWTSSEHINLLTGKSYKIAGTSISAALPALTWGDVKNGKSGMVIS